MMKIVDLILGNKIEYYGPYHGLGAFVLIIIGMIIAENLLKKVFLSLKD
jgi:hypothetical protein